MPDMFNEYETFRLKKQLPGEAIPVDSVGVVLMVFGSSSRTYEVEFVDEEARNLGSKSTFTITGDYMDSI